MNRRVGRVFRRLTVFLFVSLFFGCTENDTAAPGIQPSESMLTSDSEVSRNEEMPMGTPVFEIDLSWPKALENDEANWPDLKRNAWSIAVDRRDHIWILQSPTPEQLESEATGSIDVPRVFEVDTAGVLVRGWGGPGTSDIWMKNPPPGTPYPAGTPAEHGMWVDDDNNVWVTGNGHVALKFTPDGNFLMQIGELGQTDGSNSTMFLGNSCTLTVDAETNELYVADGYINRRVVVFDGNTGAYKRHWGAYGNDPIDFELSPEGLYTDPDQLYFPEASPQQQFLAVHCVRVANDGSVYVCDRQRNRVQVFRRDGTFVTEFLVAPNTPTELGFPQGVGATNFGSASTIGFSKDSEQRFMYVGDNMNAKIWIYRRSDLELLGSIDTNPLANHYLAVDSSGDIYNSGLQKFVLTGFETSD